MSVPFQTNKFIYRKKKTIWHISPHKIKCGYFPFLADANVYLLTKNRYDGKEKKITEIDVMSWADNKWGKQF